MPDSLAKVLSKTSRRVCHTTRRRRRRQPKRCTETSSFYYRLSIVCYILVPMYPCIAWIVFRRLDYRIIY